MEVTERNDPTKIGKGYALEWGLRHLGISPPQVVIVIDADCSVAVGTIEKLARVSLAMNRPIQALYLMNAPEQSQINYQVAVFAFRVKNWIRPVGLRVLGLPCQLMGTGMAFPWALINSVELATGAAVEDLKLGLDLARVGSPPFFFPAAAVNSQFPVSTRGAKSQRKRWEQGHLGMIIGTFPRLIGESFAHGNFSLLILCLDLAVPPLTLLAMLSILMLFISGLAFLSGVSSTSLIISATGLVAYFVAIFFCWLKFGRDILQTKSIPSVVSYIVSKAILYGHILARGGKAEWIRTDREKRD